MDALYVLLQLSDCETLYSAMFAYTCTDVCTNPCQNGGSCTASDTCDCVLGWIGMQCEIGTCNLATIQCLNVACTLTILCCHKFNYTHVMQQFTIQCCLQLD